MKTVFEHIEYVQGKPHHIRKHIAFGSAAGIAALIGFVWLAHSVGTGAFAIKGSTFAQSTEQESLVISGGENGNQNLAGVAAALQDESAPAHIEIVDVTPSTQKVKQVEQTTLPF